MENEVSIITWINGWREANGLSAEDTLTEEQAKAFLAGFKENFEFTSDNEAKVLIFGENSDPDKITELTEKYEEGTVSVVSELDEIKLADSDELRNAVAAAVGEEWFDRLYNGETTDEFATGRAFEDQLAIRDFVYSEIVKTSSASDMIALVADDADDSVWNRTLLNDILLSEKNVTLNGQSKNDCVSMIVYGVEYLGYSPDSMNKIVREYVQALAGSYNGNNILDINPGETYNEYINRMFSDNQAEKYASLISFINEKNNLKNDIVYFLSEYGEKIDDKNKQYLLDIAGIATEDIDKYTESFNCIYGVNYNYTSLLVKALVAVINDASVSDAEATEENNDVDIVSNEEKTVVDNNQPISTSQPVQNHETNLSTHNPSVSNPVNSSSNTGSYSTNNTGANNSNISNSNPAASYSMDDTNHDSSLSNSEESEENVGENLKKFNKSEGLLSLVGDIFGDISAEIDIHNSLLKEFGSDYYDAEDVNSIKLAINYGRDTDYDFAVSIFDHSSGAGGALDREYEGFKNFYEKNGLKYQELNETLGKIGDGITYLTAGVELATQVYKYAEGEISRQEALVESGKTLTGILVGKGVDNITSSVIIPAVSEACVGALGAGAAASAATVGLVALAVIDLKFLADLSVDIVWDIIDDLTDGDGETHILQTISDDYWYNDMSMAITDFLWNIFHGDDELADDYSGAKTAVVSVDPLILDLGNDGFDIIDKSEGAYFDKDNNGYRERIDWTKTDAFLALDRNNNGRIDNGSELFGDTTYINGGDGYAENGFAALKQYDENGDGVIDSNDSVFGDLRLWVDANGDGVSQSSEISTLAHHNITAISAVADEEKISTGTAAVIDGTSSFDYADGSKGRFGALWATANYYDTKEDTEAAKEGLNIAHMGNMPSLAAALAKDDGTLQGFIDAFNNAANYSEKIESLDNILFAMSGALDIDPKSRGSAIDARRLHVVETIMGEKFSGVNGANPNATAANILKNMYNNISSKYYTLFNIENIKPYIEQLVPYETANGKTKFYSGFMCISIMNEMNNNPESTILSDVCKHLAVFGVTGETDYDVLAEVNSFFSYDRALHNTVNKELLSNNIYVGTNSNDTINGSANADILAGGAGNDKLYGGNGNDTYIFGKGSGNDLINDSNGVNRIVFNDLKSTDVYVTYPTSGTDAIVTIASTGETLTIKDFRYYETYRNFTLVFDDKTLGVSDAGSPFIEVNGTDTDETIPMFYSGGSAHGFDGNDTINGTNGADTIYGDKGDDILNGNNGNDVLDGGVGNDKLYGGNGDDTYIFAKGYGNDIISDSNGKNTIRFSGIKSTEVYVTYPSTGTDAIVTVASTGETLTIKDFRYYETYRNFTLVFDDKTMSVSDTASPFVQIEGINSGETIPMFYSGGSAHGFDGDDTINGTNGADTIYGDKGDDILNGNNGNDVLDGGVGNDKLYGGNGDDTYIYAKGYGNDIISDSNGKNTIRFSGIKSTEVYVTYPSTGTDAIVTVASTGETLTIKDFRYYETYRNFTLVFDDKTMSVSDTASPFVQIEGIKSGEIIPMFYSGGSAHGFDGNDTINGTNGADTIYGDKGDDILNGYNGNDVLDGGVGNDKLYGGNGDDTYIFAKGYGNDIISDSNGKNTIRFSGIKSTEVYVTYPSTGTDAIVTVASTGETLTIKDFRYYETYRNFTLVFDDKTMSVSDTASPFVQIEGINSGETIPMFYSGGSAHGFDGNDTINGTNGADTIYGDKGDDILNGNNGNDVLDGGEGNDKLYGGNGDDTYIFAKGYGNDIISDSNGKNTIRFSGIKSTEVYVTYPSTGTDAIVTVASTGETLTIKDFRYYETYRNFTLVFDDKTMSVSDTASPFVQIEGIKSGETIPMFYSGGSAHGFDGNDTINGTNGADTIYGDKGDDILNGNNGNDVLDGGVGNDKLYGGNGDDTYIYAKGYGNDIISDSNGKNTIRFSGIKSTEVYVTYPSTGTDAIVTVASTGETLTIKDFRYYETYRNFTLVFDDKTMSVSDTASPFVQIEGIKSGETIPMFYSGGSAHGFDGNDTINGTNGADTIYGDKGDDILNGNNGSDVLDGGEGNDKLYGGNGDDTYIFAKGYGNDIISDSNGKNTIKFSGIKSTEVYVTYPSTGTDAIVTVASTGETLTIKDFRYYETYRNFTIVFDDKTMSVSDTASPFVQIEGINSGETIPMFYSGGSAHGFDGNDTINGTNGADTIYGDKGDDILNGYNGSDVLDGGVGNDKLYGGNGDDTYIYAKGYGNDIISDSNGKNAIRFSGLNSGDVTVTYPATGTDAVITITSTGETLTIRDFRYYESYRNFTLEFDDAEKAHINYADGAIIVDIAREEAVVEETLTEYLSNIYTDEVFSGELTADNTVASDYSDSISINEEKNEISDIANVQAMILAENMAAFSNDSQISDSINIGDVTDNTSALSQLLVNSSMN